MVANGTEPMSTSIGRYRIVDRLGAGGMGVVYRAEDTMLRRPVALKFLAPDIALDEEYRARFFREARILASLNHRNTCVVYEVGLVETSIGPLYGDTLAVGTPFIAMELIDGETLAARLAQSPLPVPAAVEIAVQIAEGLAEAHSQRIVHRDLKPQNVMITATGGVKIVDFGLAKPIGAVRDTRALMSTSEMISADMGRAAVIGTCAYMSPEQASGRTLDARSDVFAFGILMYQMIAGQLPFHGHTATETLAKILEADPAPLPQTAGGESRAFEHVVRRCLQKKPEDRYADARELLRDLREITLSDDARTGFTSRPAAERTTARRVLQRRRLVVSAVVSLVLLASGYIMARRTIVADRDLGPDRSSSTATEVINAPVTDTVISPIQTAEENGNEPANPRPVNDRSPGAPDEPSSKTSNNSPVSSDDPSASVGSLSVTSIPRSSVSLNGNLIGVTPLTLDVDVGTHEVILTGPDGLRWRGRVDVAPGQVHALYQDLNATGGLSVVSDAWAEVSLDERPPEQTPIHFARLTTGIHSLRVFREGYVTQVFEIFIEEGKVSSLRITLVKKP
jgi:serine/threonine protein kinase